MKTSICCGGLLFAALLLAALPTLAQSDQPAKQPEVFVPEVMDEIGINRVLVRNNAVSNGIKGVDLGLYLSYPQQSFLGGQYELFVKLKNMDGGPVLAQNRFGAYANGAGEFALTRKFRISKYRPLIGESDDLRYNLYDVDLGKNINYETVDLGARIAVFVPYYALQLPKGETEVTAKFFVRKNTLDADNAFRLPDGLEEFAFLLQKPGAHRIKVGVSEAEAARQTPNGMDWDLDIDFTSNVSKAAPDLQWKAVLATAYMRDEVFTSSTADNTFFNRWHYEYSPPIMLTSGDKLTFEVEDADWLKNPDLLGRFTLSMDSLLYYAGNQVELSSGSVRRLVLSMPKTFINLSLKELAATDSLKAWDIKSTFFDVEAPDLYCIVKDGTGKEVLHTQVVENTYQTRLPQMVIEMEVALEETLTIEIFDKDLFFDDSVAVIQVPLVQLLKDSANDGWLRLPDGSGVRLNLE